MKKILVILTVVLFTASAALWKFGFLWTPDLWQKPGPAPIMDEKIRGYWSSIPIMVYSELDDAEEMREIGINTVTFSPMLIHNQEGKVTELPLSEQYVKKSINKAHKAGIRVMLETTPMNAGMVSPRVTNSSKFTEDMTLIALKYAKIANDYDVEFFAPIVEPGHHIDIEEADLWLQELLPKLRQVYDGKIMWKKQSNDIEYSKSWDQDHIFIMGFEFNGSTRIQLKQVVEHSITLNLDEFKVSLEEYSEGNKRFSEYKDLSLSKGRHVLDIRIIGDVVTVYIDNEMLFEITDDSGPIGGYILNGPIKVNKLQIIDAEGNILYNELFENLNSFSSKQRISLNDKEVMIPKDAYVKLIHDINFSGFDFIALDTFHRGKVISIEEYIDELEYVIKKANDQAEADNVPYVILAEFGGSMEENIGWQDADPRAKLPLSEEELALTTQKVLELAEDSVDGYIYNGWNIDKQGINKVPAVKDVIRDWYSTH